MPNLSRVRLAGRCNCSTILMLKLLGSGIGPDGEQPNTPRRDLVWLFAPDPVKPGGAIVRDRTIFCGKPVARPVALVEQPHFPPTGLECLDRLFQFVPNRYRPMTTVARTERPSLITNARAANALDLATVRKISFLCARRPVSVATNIRYTVCRAPCRALASRQDKRGSFDTRPSGRLSRSTLKLRSFTRAVAANAGILGEAATEAADAPAKSERRVKMEARIKRSSQRQGCCHSQ